MSISQTMVFTLLGKDQLSPAMKSVGRAADKTHSKMGALTKMAAGA